MSLADRGEDLAKKLTMVSSKFEERAIIEQYVKLTAKEQYTFLTYVCSWFHKMNDRSKGEIQR